MNTIDLLAEMRAARKALSAEHRAELLSAGIPLDIVRLYPLIGAELVLVKAGMYRPDPDGLPAFITPVLVDNAASPEAAHPLVYARHLGECVDLVAWHPAHPDLWALRLGVATWLGCIEPQYCDPDPVAMRRSPLAWLRAGCDGLVILSRHPPDAYRILTDCQSIVAEDETHAAELRKLVRQPWPLPRIAAAIRETRSAA